MKKNILLIPILLVTLASCSSKNNIESTTSTYYSTTSTYYKEYIISLEEVPANKLTSIMPEFSVKVNNTSLEVQDGNNICLKRGLYYAVTTSEITAIHEERLIETIPTIKRNDIYEVSLNSSIDFIEIYNARFYYLMKNNDYCIKKPIDIKYELSSNNEVRFTIENNDNFDGYYFEIDSPFFVDETNYGYMKTIMSAWLFE